MAWERHAGLVAPDGGEERLCALEACTTGPYGTRARFLPNARHPHQRFCSASCRKADHDAERPRLESTE